jgi:hypothetical protein
MVDLPSRITHYSQSVVCSSVYSKQSTEDVIEELGFVKIPLENIREVSRIDELIELSKKFLYREYLFNYLTLDLGLSPRLVKVAIEEKDCSNIRAIITSFDILSTN